MYVCICKAVTDKQISHAINEGVCTQRQLYQCFGVGADCGKCNPHIKELLSLKLPKQPIISAGGSPSVLSA